jgi:hypothetical protein
MSLQQSLHGGAGVRQIGRLGQVQRRGGRQAGCFQCRAVALPALGRFGRRQVTDEGDVATPLGQQVGGGESTALAVVAAHAAVADVGQWRAPHHQRHAGTGGGFERAGVVPLAKLDDAHRRA